MHTLLCRFCLVTCCRILVTYGISVLYSFKTQLSSHYYYATEWLQESFKEDDDQQSAHILSRLSLSLVKLVCWFASSNTCKQPIKEVYYSKLESRMGDGTYH